MKPRAAAVAAAIILAASTAAASPRQPQPQGFIAKVKHLLVTSSETPRTGPGSHAEILRIANSGTAARPLPSGWSADSVSTSGNAFVITLNSTTGEQTFLRLSHKFESRIWRDAGATLSFRAECSARINTPAARACDALFRRIAKNDTSYFFDSPSMSVPETHTQFLYRYFFYRPLFVHGWLAAAAAIIFLALVSTQLKTLRAQLLPCTARSAVALALLFVAALALRMTISPAAPIHCNSHGIEEIRAYVASPAHYDNFPFNYGHIFPATMRFLVPLAGGGDSALFFLNRLFGALAVLGMFMLAKSLLESEPAALTAAAFLAFSPGQIWLSGTESQIPLFLLCATSGLAILCTSVRGQNTTLLGAAAILICYASSIRVLTVLLVPCAALIALYTALDCGQLPSRRFRLVSTSLFTAALFWAGIYYLTIPHVTAQGAAEFNARMLATWFISNRNILYDPTLTPTVVPAAAALGLAFAAFNKPKLAALLAVLFFIVVPLTFTITDCRTSVVRYQLQAYWVYYLSGGFAAAALYQWQKKSGAGKAALLVFAALFAAHSAYGCVLLARGDAEQHEYRFMRKAAAKIPPRSRVLLPVTLSGRGKLNTEFPDYINSLENVIPKKAREFATQHPAQYVYFGLDCYRYGNEKEMLRLALPGGLSHECASSCPGGSLIPVATTTLVTTHPPAGFQTTFFNIYQPRVTAGMYKCVK